MGGGKGEGMDFRGAVRGGERAGVLGEGEGGQPGRGGGARPAGRLTPVMGRRG